MFQRFVFPTDSLPFVPVLMIKFNYKEKLSTVIMGRTIHFQIFKQEFEFSEVNIRNG